MVYDVILWESWRIAGEGEKLTVCIMEWKCFRAKWEPTYPAERMIVRAEEKMRKLILS